MCSQKTTTASLVKVKMMDTSDSEIQLTPLEILAKALDVTNNSLPQKSGCTNSFSENVLLVYFEELIQSH